LDYFGTDCGQNLRWYCLATHPDLEDVTNTATISKTAGAIGVTVDLGIGIPYFISNGDSSFSLLNLGATIS
jgi:hypothetical protein